MGQVFDLNHYVSHKMTIMQLGMNDPSSDTDERQRRVWDYIKENKLSIRIETNFDFKLTELFVMASSTGV